MKKILLLPLALAMLWAQVATAEIIEKTIHYVGPTEGSVWMGIQQGVDEANLQGEFLGQKYTVEAVTVEQLNTLADVSTLLLATDADTVMKVANMPKFAQVAVFNLASDADELRGLCLTNLLNITASKQMKQDALNQWLAKHPDSTAHVQGWHEDFKKFAASQLNKRYSRTHGVKMDNDAWAGWAAVKLISDTVARVQSADAATILNYLRNDIAFDGQKGAGATFRETGQLRQLLLIISDDNKILAEAPLRGAKGGLDSLGKTSCN